MRRTTRRQLEGLSMGVWLALAPASSASDAVAAANVPAALDHAAPSMLDGPGTAAGPLREGAAADTTNESPAARPGDESAAVADEARAPWVPPARERAALGAAPVEAGGDEGVATPPSPWAWIRRLDPRSRELARMGGALGVVLGLLLLARLCLRRARGGLGGGGRPSGVLEILARYPVARGQALLLIKLARRVVLVHQSGTTMTALSELTDPSEVAALLGRMEAGARPREAVRFRAHLSSFQADHERLADAPEIIDLTRSRRRASA